MANPSSLGHTPSRRSYILTRNHDSVRSTNRASMFSNMTSVPETQDSMLYNGVSNRPRGWKSWRFSEFLEGRNPHQSNIKRWDGAARVSHAWDSLRKDPELWYNNGDCLVYLHGKGQSRRGAAFKLPLSELLAAQCHPMVERFLVLDVPESPMSAEAGEDFWTRVHAASQVELYIPAPPLADKKQALLYHLATRNFFAWVFHRSMVGEHLGSALIGLMSSMQEFRSTGVDNVHDLVSYMDEEGYLNMLSQPSYALAVLRLAETFELTDLYIDAFAHCTGMSERLYLSPEYQSISSLSRKLFRKARAEMNLRLSCAAEMLQSFLEDDLSEAHLGLSPEGRIHLDRFRTFLYNFYTARFGYYPPPSVDAKSSIFEPFVYQTMLADFGALYDYLVDKSFTTAESSPALAQGGICTLQSVHSFDLRHQYPSLINPLPLLPEIAPPPPSKRLSWFSKADKLRPDRRLVSHAAMMKATNMARLDLFDNELVLAYRKFEEDLSFSGRKTEKPEKLSPVDARKIRWILIYSVYQTLRSCALVAPEVREPRDAPYHLAVSTANLPPWEEDVPVQPHFRGRAEFFTRASSMSTSSDWTSPSQSTPGISQEIRPDVDYLALSQRHHDGAGNIPRSSSTGPPPIPERSRSLRRTLSKNGTLRRSLSFLRSAGSETIRGRPTRQTSYHEIVVHGYGNGTNHVHLDAEAGGKADAPTTPANRTASQSPSPSSSSDSDSASTQDESPPAESPRTDYSGSTIAADGQRSSLATANITAPGPAAAVELKADRIPKRTSSLCSYRTASSIYSTDDIVLLPTLSTGRPDRPPLPRKNSARRSVLDGDVFTPPPAAAALEPLPLRIRKNMVLGTMNMPGNPYEWHECDDEAEGQREEIAIDKDILPAWEQFADLGGHTPVAVAVN